MSTVPRADNASFDWNRDDSVILQDQPATAIYPNRRGEIIIRQQQQWDEEGDTVLVISRQHVIRTMYALLRAGGFNGVKLYESSNGICCQDVEDPAEDDLQFSPDDLASEEKAVGEPDENQFRLIENASAADRQKRSADSTASGELFGSEVLA
jgi:hypothetical protein